MPEIVDRDKFVHDVDAQEVMLLCRVLLC